MKRYEYKYAVILDNKTKNSKLECLSSLMVRHSKEGCGVGSIPKNQSNSSKTTTDEYADKKHGLLGDDEVEEDSDGSDCDEDIDEDEEDDEL